MPTFDENCCKSWVSSSITSLPGNISTTIPATSVNLIDCIASPTFGWNPVAEWKEEAEKIDKHVDQLEEDIAFLNEQRQEYEKEIKALKIVINDLQLELRSMGMRLDELERR